MPKHRHFIIHKPYGFLSQFKWVTNKKKKLLGELHDFPDNTMAIGRLDKTTEGLLFLTTDGKMSEKVRAKHIEKEYYAQVDGVIDVAAVEKMKKGVTIRIEGKDYLTKPCKARLLVPPPEFPERIVKIRGDWHGPTSWVSITLTEGKFKQVRKMTAVVGFPTLRLFRVRIHETWLGDLAAGGVLEVADFGIG